MFFLTYHAESLNSSHCATHLLWCRQILLGKSRTNPQWIAVSRGKTPFEHLRTAFEEIWCVSLPVLKQSISTYIPIQIHTIHYRTCFIMFLYVGVKTSTWIIFWRHVSNCCWSCCRSCTIATSSSRHTFCPCDPYVIGIFLHGFSVHFRQGAHFSVPIYRVCTWRFHSDSLSISQQGVWNSVSGFSPAWKSWIVSMEPWINTVAAETAMKQASRITSNDLASGQHNLQVDPGWFYMQISLSLYIYMNIYIYTYTHMNIYTNIYIHIVLDSTGFPVDG